MNQTAEEIVKGVYKEAVAVKHMLGNGYYMYIVCEAKGGGFIQEGNTEQAAWENAAERVRRGVKNK